jgi:arabinan endo-1,5-alpha-L-arabinosidase
MMEMQPMNRRSLLAVGLGLAAPRLVCAQGTLNPLLTGDISPVHDPCMIREGRTYHLFCTGSSPGARGAIPWRTSADLQTWTERAPALAALPDWAAKEVSGAHGAWAPDIGLLNGRYHLYYAVSTFGRNHSVIGLMTTPTLDPQAAGFGWRDEGLVIASSVRDDYNCIDPNLVVGEDGRAWLAFGSFWSGLKLVELDPKTGKPLAGAPLHSLARRRSPDAIEAPFIIQRQGGWYLFAAFDFCCRGADSTYYTAVGRAKDVEGPYVDRDGRAMMDGGGFLVLHAKLDPSGRFKGPGGASILRDGGREHIVYHAYDSQQKGVATLRIARLGWSNDGWPVAV